MYLDEIQPYVKGLIDPYPAWGGKVSTIIDDGTYPKLPGLEQIFASTGLAIIAWRVDPIGLKDRAETGACNILVHVPVLIQENVRTNRGANGTGITALRAVDYVMNAVAGKPSGPPFTPILPHEDPFADFGVTGGVWTILVNFVKQHRKVAS